ncbi:alpha/beta-hydrolase [Ascobolus immersus RN42]|uniref:feruloyl esterase n=1 Tax=Ascobolus immersus RN42 TaxID=1160509 RepID=A0A3N4ID42_ASCIM|nr:alpha/beta-hydrolase [Ascobolus immersus RN42]
MQLPFNALSLFSVGKLFSTFLPESYGSHPTCPISTLPPSYNLTVGKVARTFGLSNPSLYPECEQLDSYPIILAFHGRGASWQHMAKLTNLHDPTYCAITIYPQGLPGYGLSDGNTCDNDARRKPSWAGAPYATCYDLDHPDQPRDDFGFFHALLDYIKDRPELKGDLERVYVTGKSNGAHFTNYLACDPDASKRIAAIAPVAGPYYQAKDRWTPGRCRPSKPIAVINFQGTEDRSVEYEGSEEWINCPANSSVGDGEERRCVGKIPGIWYWFLGWGERNKCQNEVIERDGGMTEGQRIVIQSFEQCAGGKEVRHYKVVGGKHVWPARCCNLDNLKRDGSGKCEIAPVDATDEIVRFFLRFKVAADEETLLGNERGDL